MLSDLSLGARGVCGSAESLRDMVHWEVFGGGGLAGRIGEGLIVAGLLPGDASGIFCTQQGCHNKFNWKHFPLLICQT